MQFSLATSSRSGPNILLSTLSSNTLNTCSSSLSVRGQVSQIPYVMNDAWPWNDLPPLRDESWIYFHIWRDVKLGRNLLYMSNLAPWLDIMQNDKYDLHTSDVHLIKP
jgi:hypothetical protein